MFECSSDSSAARATEFNSNSNPNQIHKSTRGRVSGPKDLTLFVKNYFGNPLGFEHKLKAHVATTRLSNNLPLTRRVA